ncbi:MAG: hypothetical protein ACYDEX_00685 [Mobilitalea sp.]
MNSKVRKIVAALVMAVVFSTSVFAIQEEKAEAAVFYLTVDSFSKYLAKELKLSAVKGSYADALKEKGIIKDGDFTSLKKYLTRGDAMVLINRADEYLYGDTLDAALVQTAIDKRISDIGKIKEGKRADVAKAYLKGYVKGYSNGNYSTDRMMKGASKITKSGALGCIKMLKSKSLRAKISPDGQLIRTTGLPKNAKHYPYILASFPNAYYNWNFVYHGSTRTQYNIETRKLEELPFVNLVDFATPVDVDKTTVIENFAEVKKSQLDTWVNKVKTHMEYILNVDYRTIDSNWIDNVAKQSYTYGYWGIEDQTRERLEKYVSIMKENKTIVESNKIVVDRSSLYFFNDDYYLRVYAKYRIISSIAHYESKVLYEKNSLFYTNFPISLDKYKLGEWKECCFDVALTSYTEKEKENLGVYNASLVEYYFTGIN